MATRKPLVLISGQIAQLPSGDTLNIQVTRTVTITPLNINWLNEVINVLDFPDFPCEITAIRSSVKGTGTPTLTYNLQERPWGTNIATAGTVITSSGITATATGTDTTSFSNSSMANKAHLVLVTGSSSVISGTVEWITITVDYIITI